jgi:hypothetical protein
MTKIHTALAGALLALALATPAAAQEKRDSSLETLRGEVENVVSGSGIVAVMDSIAVASTPELQRAMEGLTATLNAFAARVANDPELRTSALRAAEGLLGVAEVAVVEQSELIQEALRAAADRIATLPEARRPVR